MFKDHSATFINKLEGANAEGLQEVAEVYKIEMIDQMETTKRDLTKTYYNIKGKAVHHPSREGYPPAIWSGELRDSLETGWNEQKKVSYVWTNVPYALELEYGRAGERPMAPRPVWYPTLFEAQAPMQKTFILVAEGEMN